ncbi:methyltransferase domain-containing protein [Micromonospora sicca]|nr:methyltransferase domain-containing protein [Micromonospora sp. 4G51]
MLIPDAQPLDVMSTLSRRLISMSMQHNTAQPASGTDRLIRLLDAADALPAAAALRARSYDLLQLTASCAVVDVGCGTGRAVAELAARGVRPIGVDRDERMIAVARARLPQADLRLGDAYQLPLPDGSVNGYRADKVLHELDDPSRALAEARRVLAPGSRIVLIGQDWDTIVIDSDDPALTRTIVHARADTIPAPRAARRYRNLLMEAGFLRPDVEVRTGVFTDATMLPMLAGFADAGRTTGAVTGDQADAWVTDQRRRAANDRLFLALPLFVASARRP